jgi:hypothetical protein
MNEQEKAFWEIWDKIESHYWSYNHRQMFDFGYLAAKEQIIKLLEAQLPNARTVGTFYTSGLIDAIAMVKGDITEIIEGDE